MSISEKIKSYIKFTKFRLSFLVILSALSGYLFVGGDSWMEVFYLMIGGMLVTAASNGSNQIWERDLDKLMKRTESRPIPQGHMSVNEGIIVVVVVVVVKGVLDLGNVEFNDAGLRFVVVTSSSCRHVATSSCRQDVAT